MVLEEQILPYLQWLLGTESAFGALPNYILVLCVLALLAIGVGYAVAASRRGLVRGGDTVYNTVSVGFRELFSISPRRIWALARLAMKEARRRRVEVALVVFLVILAFANWFLSADNQNPAKLYVSFVLTATTYLVLGVALVLSTFSLPSDFKTKTIYTVVTKPVYASEIILGRILGFSLVGTILLLLIAVSSYFFVTRSLSHTHRVEKDSLTYAKGNSGEVIGYRGRTSLEAYHRHDVELDPEKDGAALSNYDHFHRIESDGDLLIVGESEGAIRARLPKWGKLSFLDRQGVPKEHGINVGNEWTYRSFIDGRTQAAAIWTFDDIDKSLDSGDGLPVGLIVRVFRTHKGVIGQAIRGAIQVRNSETKLRSDLIPFAALDNKIEEFTIKQKLVDTNGRERDLYEDFVTSTGQLEIRIQCMERGQYFGFAQPDCYIRLPDASPVFNYVKVYTSIWVQMVIVIAIGVVSSSILSGPVAMLLTVSFILLGFKRDFFIGIAAGDDYAKYGVEKVYGGGPIESAYRMATQKNVITDLDPGVGTSIINGIDAVLQKLMLGVSQVLPDFSQFSTVKFAAFGFDVPTEKVGADLTVCLAYLIGLAVVGYFLLRTREVAK